MVFCIISISRSFQQNLGICHVMNLLKPRKWVSFLVLPLLLFVRSLWFSVDHEALWIGLPFPSLPTPFCNQEIARATIPYLSFFKIMTYWHTWQWLQGFKQKPIQLKPAFSRCYLSIYGIPVVVLENFGNKQIKREEVKHPYSNLDSTCANNHIK